MDSEKYSPRFLGAAFFIVAVASLVSGNLLESLMVSGNITDSMTNISTNAVQMRTSIVGEMITAIGIIILGSLLFATLKKQNGKIALVALGLYLMEAALLAASRISAFLLLRISQESVMAGHPTYLQTLGNLLYESQRFGYALHLLVFALGAILFYYLFFKSRLIPQVLSLWGIIATSLVFIGTLFILFDYDVPLVVFAPNMIFELAIGIWIMAKGIKS